MNSGSYVPPHLRGRPDTGATAAAPGAPNMRRATTTTDTESRRAGTSMPSGGRDGAYQNRRASAAGPEPAQPEMTPAKLRDRGEDLQQKADRRGGQEGYDLYDQAAQHYLQALEAPLPAGLAPGSEERLNCIFAVGECLQSMADFLLSRVEPLSDDLPDIRTQESATQARAFRRLEDACKNYSKVSPAPGVVREDALVNMSNALCSIASLPLKNTVERCQLLQQAVTGYRVAIKSEECAEDPAVWGNLGDALVQLGEELCSAGYSSQAEHVFQEGITAYETACSLSDSSQGDDLPSLLHNWGAGLFSMAAQMSDKETRYNVLEQAIDKLQAAVRFGNRADCQPMNALGDAYCALGDVSAAQGDSSSAAGFYRCAIEEGYEAAMRISQANVDSHLGVAEARVSLGKLLVSMGDLQGAYQCMATGVASYGQAIGISGGRLAATFAERCDVRYNAACAASLAGDIAFCKEQLTWLASRGALNREEAEGDSDLAFAKGQAFWNALWAEEEMA